MASDEIDGSAQTLVERHSRRPAHGVAGARIVRDQLHDLAQCRTQALVVLDDRLVDLHEFENAPGEPTDGIGSAGAQIDRLALDARRFPGRQGSPRRCRLRTSCPARGVERAEPYTVGTWSAWEINGRNEGAGGLARAEGVEGPHGDDGRPKQMESLSAILSAPIFQAE